MRWIALVSILNLLSCTTINQRVVVEQYAYDYIDSTIDPILNSFIYEAGIRGHKVDLSHVTITFGLKRENEFDQTVGYCAKDRFIGVVIKLHKESFNELNDYGKEELVFHELGHCLIGRSHCGRVVNNEPISIMYPSILNQDYYKDNREELVDELFNPSLKCFGNNGKSNESNRPVCVPKNIDEKR